MKKNILSAVFLVLGGLFVSHAQCKTQTTLTENFDNWKDIDRCWTAHSGEAMLYVNNGKVVFYSMTNPEEKMILTTPKFVAGDFSLSLDALNKSGKATIVIGQITDASDLSTFEELTKPVEITEGTKEFSFTVSKEAHIGIKIFLTGVHQAVYIDDVAIKPVRK